MSVYSLVFLPYICSLETALRSYTCLTTGDTVLVSYNNTKYYINVIETKPSSAVSIVETDCEVDFAPPLDYKEPEKPASTLSNKALGEGCCLLLLLDKEIGFTFSIFTFILFVICEIQVLLTK